MAGRTNPLWEPGPDEPEDSWRARKIASIHIAKAEVFLRREDIRRRFSEARGQTFDELTLKEATGLFLKQPTVLRSPKKQKRRKPPARNGILDGRSPRPASDAQRVYVIGAPGSPIKIGIAKDVHQRRRELQTGHPHKLTIYAEVKATDARLVEQRAHTELADYRLSGEWFDIDPYEAVEVVRRLAA